MSLFPILIGGILQEYFSIIYSFLDDIEVMLKWRPPVVYKYLWKYVCLLAMIGLLAASLLRMVLKRPTYTAWNQNTVRYWTYAFYLFVCFLHITITTVDLFQPGIMWSTQYLLFIYVFLLFCSKQVDVQLCIWIFYIVSYRKCWEHMSLPLFRPLRWLLSTLAGPLLWLSCL